MSFEDEDRCLAEMLALADRLVQSKDALMVGQYVYLRARIMALLALREGATG